MNFLQKDIALGFLRHILGGIGGFIVAHGWLTNAQDAQFIPLLAQVLLGAAMFVAALVTSAMQKVASAPAVVVPPAPAKIVPNPPLGTK